MLNPTTRILTAIPSTEPCSLNELLKAMGDDAPQEQHEWRPFFLLLDSLQEMGLVDIELTGLRIDTLQLTALGAERAREALRGER